jgi:hypothetical protein
MRISDQRGRLLRHLLPGLGAFAVAAAAGLAATPALAQFDDYGGGHVYYERGYDYGYGYGYGRRFREAPPPSVPPRAMARLAAREHGLRDIRSTVRTGSAFVFDGTAANGSKVRLILDRYSGELIDRIVLEPAPSRTVRLDPREEQRPSAKPVIPRPPERPAALKPAQPEGQAVAPATVLPPSPAAPQPEPAPAKPAALPSEATKPALVNPQDVRDSGEPDRLPPLARAIPSPDTTVPPVRTEDFKGAGPKPETQPQFPPYAPLE